MSQNNDGGRGCAYAHACGAGPRHQAAHESADNSAGPNGDERRRDTPARRSPRGLFRKRRPGWARVCALIIGLLAAVLAAGAGWKMAFAEFGDVVINNYSDDAGMRPVVFPHWFHRIRFRCKVCHSDLGFEFKAGGNDINMLKIFDGEFCGACHNGEVAWGVENCILCHSGKPGLRTQVHNSTASRLVAPISAAKPK